MNVLEQALVPAIVLGLTYAVVATGFVLLYKALGILSFAQGSFMVFGALIFYTFRNSSQLPVIIALLVSLMLTALVGGLTYWLVYGRKLGADPLMISFSTVGLGTLLSAAIYLIWGTAARNDPPLFHLGLTRIANSIVINPSQWLTILMSLFVIAAVACWIKFTPTGIKMRATADRQTLAAYYGISVGRIAMLAWMLAALCAAAGGIAFSAATNVDPVNLSAVGLAVFPALIVGGIDSIAGALVGGLLVALVSTVIGIEFGGQYESFASYAVLLGMLMIRPQGLFGTPDVTRL